ncbi:MAG: hypothetical protein B6U95_05590 [Thermofilum sp. ex4484_82]|nr:MAG: hypothetical protein B6U95_05590 [Thermofilum sp. ex4484_82]OYT37900.1 MAG: hypothetical protein B6U96_05585 [Archaeoglobales archaeon ex4484_92]
MGNIIPPPEPIVKVPVLIKHAGVPPRKYRKGRGYSKGEIQALGLTMIEARKLGIYVDSRRKTVYDENIERLKEWLERVKKGEIEPPDPTMPKVIKVKPAGKKVFKGKTMAGRKMRGLLKKKYRYTHQYKWKRKQKERKLKKGHEAKRHKGGH